MKQIDRCPFAHRQMMHGVSDSQFAGCHQTKCITFSTYNVACVTIIIRNCVGMHQRETLLTTEEKKNEEKTNSRTRNECEQNDHNFGCITYVVLN